ncbi:MAG: type III pantothenate kinase [Gammaproteobacteria bacterium]|nr:type III pantothenate kinase [Gammaproteobacteria bacterium]
MTRCLDLDIGNSRTKWRCGPERGSVESGVLPQLHTSIDRVRVASVISSHGTIESSIRGNFGVDPEFAFSSHTLAGVTNCYKEPRTLGVDRWLALVAAWNSVRSSVLVIDAGTALTVDVANERGLHMGGYIAPGLETMRESLAADTDNVQVAFLSNCGSNLDFGTNTEEAVQNGLLSMVVAWLSRCRILAKGVCDNAPTVFLTGGDGERLSRWLDFSCQIRPDLVLEGLAIALP